MFFKYTCFSCKYFSSSISDDTHTSYARITYTLAFGASIFRCQSVTTYMLLMHVFHIHLLFGASIFRRQSVTTHMLFMHVFRLHFLFGASIFRRQLVTTHMLLMHVFRIHLLFGTSIFRCQSMTTHMLLMHIFRIHLLFCTSIFHCSFRELHEFIMLVFLVIQAWRVLRFSTSEFFGAMMWTMVPSFTRRKRYFVWRMQIEFIPCDIFLIGATINLFFALILAG